MTRTPERLLALTAGLALLATLSGCGARYASESAPQGPPTVGSPIERQRSVKGDGVGSSSSPVADEAGVATNGNSNGTDETTRLVIRKKSLRLRVDNVEKAVSEARALAVRFDGSIEQVRLSSEDEPIYGLESDAAEAGPLGALVVMRVPAAKFEQAVAQAARLGVVLREAESADDVTQQHVDLAARLRNLRAEAARLRALFARAGNVSEMLKVERELSRVQGEIEAMQAQLDYLERQTAMATVRIGFVEPEPIAAPMGEDWGFRQALADAIRGFVGTVNGLIVLFGESAPLLLLAAAFALAIRTLLRKRSPSGGSPTSEAPAVDGNSQ